MVDHSASQQDTAIFLAIHLGRLRLLVPQEHVRTVESAADIRTPTSKPGAFGSIRVGRERLPVYALSESLREFHAEAGPRRVCPILASRQGSYGVLCDEVGLIPVSALDIRPLPAAMRQRGAAIGGLAMHGGALVCVSSADALLGTLELLIDALVAVPAVA